MYVSKYMNLCIIRVCLDSVKANVKLLEISFEWKYQYKEYILVAWCELAFSAIYKIHGIKLGQKSNETFNINMM